MIVTYVKVNYQLCFHDAHNDEPLNLQPSDCLDWKILYRCLMKWWSKHALNWNEFDPTWISIDFGVR